MRFVCTLRGKPLGLNSAFRSGRDSMTDLNLDVHMVAASRKTDMWKVLAVKQTGGRFRSASS